jgi:hypothetical protein
MLGNYLAKHNTPRIVCRPYDIYFHDAETLTEYYKNNPLHAMYNYNIYNKNCYKYLVSKNMFYFAKTTYNTILTSTEDSNKMTIIASMTTIPSRIAHMKTVVECILNQTVPFSHLEINIPEKCIRTGETYVLPEWLTCMPRVKIFRTPDYGAITKVAPTFLRYQNSAETYIWSCDDDVKYPNNSLALYTDGVTPFSKEARGYHSINIHSNLSRNWSILRYPHILEGFGSVLYAPQIIKDDFKEYLEFIVKTPECKNDDIMLGNYLAKHNISRISCRPHNVIFNDDNVLEKYYNANDALRRVYNEYDLYNRDCYLYLIRKNIFYFNRNTLEIFQPRCKNNLFRQLSYYI